MQQQVTNKKSIVVAAKEATSKSKVKYYNSILCFNGDLEVSTFKKSQEERAEIKRAKYVYNKVLFSTFGTKRPTAGILNRYFGI